MWSVSVDIRLLIRCQSDYHRLLIDLFNRINRPTDRALTIFVIIGPVVYSIRRLSRHQQQRRHWLRDGHPIERDIPTTIRYFRMWIYTHVGVVLKLFKLSSAFDHNEISWWERIYGTVPLKCVHIWWWCQLHLPQFPYRLWSMKSAGQTDRHMHTNRSSIQID